MAKLTNKQMFKLTRDLQNSLTKIPEGVSKEQYKNFVLAYEGENSVNYMVSFFDFVRSFDNLYEAQYALDNLQDADKKPLISGDIVLSEPEKVKANRFVLTSAQNNTEVHTEFFKALKSYCKINNAELLIGKYTYNKNGFQKSETSDDGIHYAPELLKYFNTSELELCEGLTWCGQLNILPTVKNPLTGFESLTKGSSFIVPHAKISLESIATAKNKAAKLGYSTGTLTLHNYIQKKAGQIAQHHHCYGALIVEISDDGLWYVRQVQTDTTGIFQDLKTVYLPNGKTKKGNIEAINWGDIHAEKIDLSVLEACTAMLKDFKPKNQLFHDLFDMQARNHHNRKSGRFLAKMHFDNLSSVRDDIIQANDVLSDFDIQGSTKYIVESNHDLALESWLDSNDYDFKSDPINALTYLALQTYVYEQLEAGEEPQVLKFALTDFIGSKLNNTKFLMTDESLVIAGVECGMHGHLGTNGSRGSPQQFQKLNTPLNTGHTHAASIKGGVYTAGVTGSFNMGYNKGAGSWSHSHILTYPSGFRTIITMQQKADVGEGGEWEYKA